MFELKRITSFLAEEGGAVTVDWVALMAALVLIGIGVATTVNTSTKNYADRISADIATRDVWTYS